MGNFYEGGETELRKVRRNLTYAELSRLVEGVANVDLTKFSIDLRTLVDTGVRLRPARPKIKDDSDVEMLLCDDGHVPEVYVTVVEKVSVEPGHVGVEPGHVGVRTDQPVYESFLQQLAAQFQSAGGSNNVVGSIPTTDHAIETPSVNPIICEDLNINEAMLERYNDDERSIPDYNPHSDYGLDDFDEDYSGHDGSREGVNDEPVDYDGMDTDPSRGGCSGSIPPVFGGPNRDTCEDDAINVGDGSGTAVSQPWIIPGASNYSFEVVRTEESSSCNRLCKGGMFQTKKSLKFALQRYALKENFEIRVTRSSLCRYEVGCKDPVCKFQFRAAKMEGGSYWIVRKLEEEHTCTIDDLHNRNRQASAWLIGEILAPKLAVSGRSLKPKEIMTDMQVEHGLRLNYTKAWKAKEHAENNVFGPLDMSYQLLSAYCHELKRVNLGTITAIKTNDAHQFEYLFIALSASLNGFHTSIRPAICIDATHLKGKFGGVMFIAACQDANNQVFPLAYGWGDVECEDSWTWFLKELKKAIGCPGNCIIISDRSPAIKVAMATQYPEITHGLCGFHMNMNLKNRFRSQVVCNLFHEASRAHRESEFLEKMQELSRINMRAYDYLMKVGPHRWSRAYCPVRRYRGMTSNIVECMNNCLRHARQLPITTLVEYIRDMMQKWFHERRETASKNETQLSRWATKKLTKKNEYSHKYTVRPIDNVNFNVKDGEKNGLVNLSEKTCTCKEFQNDLLPCSHALAAIRYIFL